MKLPLILLLLFSVFAMADTPPIIYKADAPLVKVGTHFSIPAATSLIDGYLRATDFSNFAGSVLPNQSGHSGHFLTTNGTITSWAPATASTSWGLITGTLSNQTDLQSALDLKMDFVTPGTVGNVLTSNGSAWISSAPPAAAVWGSITGTLSNQTDLSSALSSKEPTITAGTSSQFWRGDKTFQTLNTLAVPELTNLYYTDARARAAISATAPISYDSLTGIISFSGSSGVSGVTASPPLFSSGGATPNITIQQSDATHDGYISSGDWGIFNSKEPAITSSTTSKYWRGDKSFQTLDTAAVPENGSLYYTQGRFDSAFTAKSTTNLTEGTNLYYTNGRVDSEFDTRLATKSTSNLAEGSNLYYTNARASAAAPVQTVAGRAGAVTLTTADISGNLAGDVGGPLSATLIGTGAVTDAKASLATKPAVTVVATTNQTLSGLPIVDGIQTAANSLILLTAQSTPSQNGPWSAQVGAWVRPSWYPSGGTTQVFQFITTLVRLGSTYSGTIWRNTSPAPIIIDTTATTWVITKITLNASTSIKSDATHDGFLDKNDWTIFNNKLSASAGNYISNPTFEVDTSGWNLYNDSGNPAAAYAVDQDITYTSALSGNAGNGATVTYALCGGSYVGPVVTCPTATSVQVCWYNGPSIAQNPTATVLKAAYDAQACATAIATSAITGTASNRQYITGTSTLADGGDTAPVDGTGGVVSGVTFTRNAITPLIGSASGDLGKDGSSEQGQGASIDFTINSVDQNAKLQISFVYSGSSGMVLGSSSDVRVFVYDITNAVLIPVKPLKTIAGPVSTAKTFVGTFQASSSVNYRLITHIATASATVWDLLLDSVTINDNVAATTATQVPSVVITGQPISGAVTDHMVVMWRDGSSQWVPATIAGAAIGAFGTDITQLGFATNIVGATADIFVHGYMGGFSFGPFTGYEQYIDNTAGLISPLPSPFNDMYVMVGMAISSTELNIQFNSHVDQVSNGSGIPVKGGLLTAGSANDGTGDVVLSPGANGTFLVANSAVAKGLNYRVLASADIPNNAANTTGSAATLTTARTIAGTSFNGSANITLANKFIVQGTTDAGLSGPQFLGALATGLLKNTTTTGVLSIAAASDVTGQLLTGFVSGSGTVAATETILQGINKLDGNVALKAALASPTFSGTPSLPTGTTGVTQAAADSSTKLATTAFVTTADNLKANIASPTLTGDVTLSTGNLLFSTIGKGPQVKTGTNSKIGQATLVAGTVTVANTSVTANSRIFLTVSTAGGTQGFLRTSKSAGTSFTITSTSGTETSVVDWIIVESIP